ncbi:MAG: cytochrome c oxidase subunit II [Methylococcales bacterium]
MAIAIALVLIVIGSIWFHFWSPWWITPLASNWGLMDDTLMITFVVTGFVFVAVNLFMAYALVRFRYREDRRAKYEPENKKLELWLTGLTTVGIVIMLAPGLIVLADFVHVPKDAAVIEAVGKQWQWSFRFPGKDGVLGNSKPQLISFQNPFGLNPDDPNGQDDVLINNSELHLPVDKPVQVLLRSKDVLHDFYVPHFRVKMDAVPGIITMLWFTPTKIGRFDIACAEYCGIGHHTMRGAVFVEDQDTFQNWLNAQPTFAQSSAKQSTGAESKLVEQGRLLAEEKGCLGCHSLDGSAGTGPTWKGLLGKTETLADGSTVTVDKAYIKESILDPGASVIEGYSPIMSAYQLSDKEIAALIAFTTSLSSANENTEQEQGSDLADIGQKLAAEKGCLGCHSVDGGASVGPTWKGLFGKTETMTDNTTLVIDEAYLKEAILEPNTTVVAGFSPMMPAYDFSDEELDALIAYTKTLQ